MYVNKHVLVSTNSRAKQYIRSNSALETESCGSLNYVLTLVIDH